MFPIPKPQDYGHNPSPKVPDPINDHKQTQTQGYAQVPGQTQGPSDDHKQVQVQIPGETKNQGIFPNVPKHTPFNAVAPTHDPTPILNAIIKAGVNREPQPFQIQGQGQMPTPFAPRRIDNFCPGPMTPLQLPIPGPIMIPPPIQIPPPIAVQETPAQSPAQPQVQAQPKLKIMDGVQPQNQVQGLIQGLGRLKIVDQGVMTAAQSPALGLLEIPNPAMAQQVPEQGQNQEQAEEDEDVDDDQLILTFTGPIDFSKFKTVFYNPLVLLTGVLTYAMSLTPLEKANPRIPRVEEFLGCIYGLFNTITEMWYVGQAKLMKYKGRKPYAYGAKGRFSDHKSVSAGKDREDHEDHEDHDERNTPINEALRTHEFSCFRIRILEVTTMDKLDARETYYINQLGSAVPHGYNVVVNDTNRHTENRLAELYRLYGEITYDVSSEILEKIREQLQVERDVPSRKSSRPWRRNWKEE